jgi:uncharacterized protein YecT (DUF1311 family)
MVIVLLLTLAQKGMAKETMLSEQYSECMNQSSGVTVTILDCIATETKKQEFLLNKAYKKVMENLSVKRKKQFHNTQSLWIKYRDANCDFYTDADSGSLATIVLNKCFLTEISLRRKEIEKVLLFEGIVM